MKGILAIIPARGASKGIPRKNLRMLGSLPLIGHTLRAALGVSCIDTVIVSTDSREIADFAGEMGVPTEHLRPAHLAEDNTPSTAVVEYELAAHRERTGTRAEHVMLLQPTAPLRQARHIDEAVAVYEASGADSLISVCDVGPGHPDYMYRAREGLLERFLETQSHTRRQELPRLYLRNGAIYIAATSYFERTGKLIAPHTAYYEMDRRSSVNIDEPEDLSLAQALLNLGH
jgi:CMP-N,N'-diacetyllegionaminic acid synthase